MSSFEFDNDWGERLREGAEDIAKGRLPGRLGVLQDVVHHWAIPKSHRGWVRYGKALLDTFGTLYSYHQDEKDSRDEGRDPCREWLKKNGYERAYSSRATSFSSFVRRALDGAAFRNTTVKGKKKKRGRLLAFDIGKGKQAFFIPRGMKGDVQDEREVSVWWEGPFVKSVDKVAFVRYVRERIWKIMGTKALMISPTGTGNYTDRIELSALTDSIDYVCGRDEHNNVDALAERCVAFLDKGIQRNLLFVGPPGTGKSTLSRSLAQRLDRRAVLVDHDAVRRMNKSAHLIISLLGPGVLILNDVDRVEGASHRELLNALEVEYAGDDANLLTCLTVNDITQLDPALLRPGRIHEIREVPEPSAESVSLILDYYKGKYGLQFNDAIRARFLKQAVGFSPADIREFAETARAVGPDLAVEEIQRIKDQRKYYAGDRCREFNRAQKADSAAPVPY